MKCSCKLVRPDMQAGRVGGRGAASSRRGDCTTVTRKYSQVQLQVEVASIHSIALRASHSWRAAFSYD